MSMLYFLSIIIFLEANSAVTHLLFRIGEGHRLGGSAAIAGGGVGGRFESVKLA